MKLYFDLIIIGIAVQVVTNMPNAVADVPEKFDAKFVTPNQHVYTGEYHSVMPEPGMPGGPLAPPIFGRSVNPIHTGGGQIFPTYYYWPPNFFHLPASLPYGSQINNTKLPYTKSISLKLTQT